MKIYFNQLLIYENKPESRFLVVTDLCKDLTLNNILFRCPNQPVICANQYQDCAYINRTRCTNNLTPFLCGDRCVSNMHTECCRIGDRNLPDFKWCPHLNSCVNTTLTQCPSIGGKLYYCESRRQFVAKRTDCCEDFKYNVTRIEIDDSITILTRSMVKCSFEEKCVPENTAEFCFFSFERNCAEIFGSEYSFQCRNDGKCRRNATECPSPRVCPPGFTQCPDYTCIRGLDKFSQCNKL